MIEVRCEHQILDKDGQLRPCRRKLGEFDGKAEIKCPKCKNITNIDTERQTSAC